MELVRFQRELIGNKRRMQEENIDLQKQKISLLKLDQELREKDSTLN